MTNAESYLNEAIEALEAGKLSSYEENFIESIKDYSKKQLRDLSSKQFLLLRDISRKYSE